MHRLLLGISDDKPTTHGVEWLEERGVQIIHRDLVIDGGKIDRLIHLSFCCRIWIADVSKNTAILYLTKMGGDLRDVVDSDSLVGSAIFRSLEER